MKILVCGDIHGRTFWKDAVEKHLNDCDRIIFLGDYLDPYPAENITRKFSISNFGEIIEFKKEHDEKVVLLLGNHDCHYYSSEFHTRARYDSANARRIMNILKKNRSLFKLAHTEIINGKSLLFTHAGLMNSWVERNKDIIGEPTEGNLNKLLDTPQGICALTDVSRYRTWLGERSGSIVWSDVREKIDAKSMMDEIIPNDDSAVDMYDFQVFGHTMLVDKPIITDKWICVDCKRAFLINDDGSFVEA